MRKIILLSLAVFCICLISLVLFAGNREEQGELISPIPDQTELPTPSESIQPSISGYRETAIKELLSEFDSPLANKSGVFVSCADEHDINPYLLVGISRIESTFGKNACEGNPFGWSSCRIPFSTFESSCQAVAKGIANLSYYEQYRSTGRLKDLGETYCPPSTGCNTEHWVNTVGRVMADLEENELVLSLAELATLTPTDKSIKELEVNTQVLKSHSTRATGTTLEVIEILIRANEKALRKTQHES